LLGINKCGDTYLSILLIHGARAAVRFAEKKTKPEGWLRRLIARRNKNVAAEQECRIIWALLAKGTTFHPDHTSAASATAD